MSMLEGGDFVCYIHNYKTDNSSKWEYHCFKTNHMIEGYTQCLVCKKPVNFKDIPFMGLNNSPQLRCEKCK